MSILIKGMEMPSTGLYFVSVDNAGGRDKTIVTVERMLGNRDVRQIVGSFELIPVPPHGCLIDADALDVIGYCGIPQGREDTFDDGVMWLAEQIDLLPTIIPAEEGK